jgi:hypothetical protein
MPLEDYLKHSKYTDATYCLDVAKEQPSANYMLDPHHFCVESRAEPRNVILLCGQKYSHNGSKETRHKSHQSILNKR